jgi:hypothetical protein
LATDKTKTELTKQIGDIKTELTNENGKTKMELTISDRQAKITNEIDKTNLELKKQVGKLTTDFTTPPRRIWAIRFLGSRKIWLASKLSSISSKLASSPWYTSGLAKVN